MVRRKLNVKRLVIAIIMLIVIFMLFAVSLFFFMLSPVGKSKSDIKYVVESGTTPYEVFKDLEEKNIIRSELFTKLYVKLTGSNIEFKAGTYTINDSMGSIEIIKVLSGTDYISGDEISLTFKEGFEMVDFIEIVSSNTNIKEEEIKGKLKDKEYIKGLIEKYWFLTEDVLDEDIYYSLEGYLFPNTYFVNKNGNIEQIIETMLNETERVLNKYKDDIENSEYTVHELLTMASIIEKEATLDEDRPLVASVFYNRLDVGMPFQSCATLGYAIGEWKLTYTQADKDTDSPYNTYVYAGFPPGPGDNAGEESIEAAIYPAESDYYYFMADVCSENPKTYFSKNYEEHVSYVNKYLTCF